MQSVTLPGGGRVTTQLGFGCAYLAPDNVRVLEAAYAAGIRHFDVARSYGRGLSEGMLGRFLKRHEGQITVTSKYGINPPFSHPLHAGLRVLARPLIRRLRKSTVIGSHIDQLPVVRNCKADFTGEEARTSLSLSLRNLKLSLIDIFLMHEPEPADLMDPGLLQVLGEAVRRHEVGVFGVGGKSQLVASLRARSPEFCTVLQYDWTPLEAIPSHPGTMAIVYRVYGGRVRELRAELDEKSGLRRKWSDDIDCDLSAPGMFEQLMLNAALVLRPDALVLFSSTRPERVLANVRAATDSTLTPAALRLVEYARSWDQSRSEV